MDPLAVQKENVPAGRLTYKTSQTISLGRERDRFLWDRDERAGRTLRLSGSFGPSRNLEGKPIDILRNPLRTSDCQPLTAFLTAASQLGASVLAAHLLAKSVRALSFDIRLIGQCLFHGLNSLSFKGRIITQ